MKNEPKITLPFLKEALKNTPSQFLYSSQKELHFHSIQTDSRTLTPHDLFTAISGDQFNGHQFIDFCIEKGVKGILCEKLPKNIPPDVLFIQTTSSIEALRAIAEHWKSFFNIPFCAVMGSVGKTTTKELLAAILSGKYKNILKTQKSQNGFLGIALTLLSLKKENECAVIEVGIDECQAMHSHMNLLQPNFGVLTAIGEEHLEKLINIETVAKEELFSLRFIEKNNGKCAIHLDDPYISPLFTELNPAQTLGYTLNKNHPFLKTSKDKIVRGELSEDQKSLTLYSSQLSSPLSLSPPLLGLHNIYNLLSAVSLALLLGLNSKEIQEGLKQFKPEAGRSELIQLTYKNLICLNDSYNANPTSMRAAFSLIKNLQNEYKNVTTHLCLGDMLELGPEELKLHQALAKDLKEIKNALIYLFGPKMKSLYDCLDPKTTSHFHTKEDLIKKLSTQLKPNDLLLIKGSRGMQMEKVLTALQEQS